RGGGVGGVWGARHDVNRAVARGVGDGVGESAVAVVEQNAEVVRLAVGHGDVGVAVQVQVGEAAVGGLRADGVVRGLAERAVAVAEQDGDAAAGEVRGDQVGEGVPVHLGRGRPFRGDADRRSGGAGHDVVT